MEVLIIKDKRPPANRCIYCPATDNLTLEHIIPHGLWGRIEFPQASCKACAEKINVFETQVMNSIGAMRQRAGIPLRKRRKRDYRLKVSFAQINDGPPPPDPIELSADEIPKSLLLMRLCPPEILGGRWGREPLPWMYMDEDREEFDAKYPTSAVFYGAYDHHNWCRLIAKIGHGLVLGYFPPSVIETFDLLLPDLILNGTDNYRHLIGGDYTLTPPSKLLHEWSVRNAIRGETEYLFASVRLFANLGSPVHHAVVASRPLGQTTVTKDPARYP